MHGFGLAALTILGVCGSAGCAIVLGYGDYVEGNATTTSTDVGGGGAGTTSATSTSSAPGGGGTGGSVPLLVADYSYRGGDGAGQLFTAVSIAPSGQILVVGDYMGSMDLFGAVTASSPTGFDFVAAGLQPGTGAPVWTRSTIDSTPAGSTLPRVGLGIAGDSAGHAFATAGVAHGGSAFSGLVVGIDTASGSELWTTPFDGGTPVGKSQIAVDESGSIHVIAESLNGAFTFGTSIVPAGAPTGRDIAVVSCKAPCTGGTIAILGGPADEDAHALAVDPVTGSDLFITGEYRGTWGNMPDAGAVRSTFVTRVAGGSIVWARGFVKTQGASCTLPLQQAHGYAIATTASGDVVVTGVMCGETSFGVDTSSAPVVLPGKGGADVFVALLDGATGAVKWARSFGDAGEQVGTGVAVGDGGSVFMTGTFSGKLDFGGGALLDAGPVSQSIFLAELDPQGTHVRSTSFGAGEAIETRSVHIAARQGALVLAGAWKTTLAFGDGSTLDPHGSFDAFLAKLTP